MARSVWKGPFVDMNLLKKAEKVSNSKRKEVIKTWSRRSTIRPKFVGLTFGVYKSQRLSANFYAFIDWKIIWVYLWS